MPTAGDEFAIERLLNEQTPNDFPHIFFDSFANDDGLGSYSDFETNTERTVKFYYYKNNNKESSSAVVRKNDDGTFAMAGGSRKRGRRNMPRRKATWTPSGRSVTLRDGSVRALYVNPSVPGFRLKRMVLKGNSRVASFVKPPVACFPNGNIDFANVRQRRVRSRKTGTDS